MAFCGSCGAQAEDGLRFCPSCGKEMAAATPPQPQPQQQYQAPPQQQPYGQQQPYAQQYPQQPRPPQSDAEANKLMGVLGFLIFWLPLITGDYKKSPFVKFNVNQGVIMCALSVAYCVIAGILIAIGFATLFTGTPVIMVLFIIFACLLYLPVLALTVLGIVNAVKGQEKPLPVVGKLFVAFK
ncbi:MAG: zinc ribbon domain-containing protein [Oscillospiraceae bacterium]|nr:zinc ribbon domain-containing protein [Oscillospiraceae bacterium]